jgi:hypothetical protein
MIGGVDPNSLRRDPNSSNPREALLTVYRGDVNGNLNSGFRAKDPTSDNSIVEHAADTKDKTKFISTTTDPKVALEYAHGNANQVFKMEIPVLIDGTVSWNNDGTVSDDVLNIPVKTRTNNLWKVYDLTDLDYSKQFIKTQEKNKKFPRKLKSGKVIHKTAEEVLKSSATSKEVLIERCIIPSDIIKQGLNGLYNFQSININCINSYFTQYTLGGIQKILKLRLAEQNLTRRITTLSRYTYNKDYTNIHSMFFKLNRINAKIILVSLALYNKHAVGIILVKQRDSSIKAFYIDPENEIIPKKLENIFVAFGIIVKQVSVEEQRYTNCGPEVIENFIYYLTGTRATQEGAVYVHSLLLENTLLDPVEYALKISENNKLIRFLSNQELIIDRPVMSTDRLKKITMFTDVYITESFFSGRKHYTNYSLEVKEKFILYMTREHLA